MISFFHGVTSALSLEELKDLAARRQMRHVRGAFPDAGKILSWGWMEDHMARHAAHPEKFRFFLKGRKIDPVMFGLVSPKEGLLLEKVRSLLSSGLTVIFNYLEESSDYFWEQVIAFEQALQAVVSLDAIGSFGTAPGLSPHYDNQDLLLVQIAGRKRWQVLGTPIDGPFLCRDFPAPQTVTDEFVMEPGDVLFVPAGLHHQCFPLEPSLHLGALIRRPCGSALLSMMLRRWEQDPALGERLFLRPEEADLARQEEALKQALVRLVQDTDMTELARNWLARKQRPVRRGLPGVGTGGD